MWSWWYDSAMSSRWKLAICSFLSINFSQFLLLASWSIVDIAIALAFAEDHTQVEAVYLSSILKQFLNNSEWTVAIIIDSAGCKSHDQREATGDDWPIYFHASRIECRRRAETKQTIHDQVKTFATERAKCLMRLRSNFLQNCVRMNKFCFASVRKAKRCARAYNIITIR